MKKGKFTEEYKILNEKGEISFVDKFNCPNDSVFENDGKQYVKLYLSEKVTFLLPVEDVEDEEIPAKTRLRKLFSKKVEKNLEN